MTYVTILLQKLQSLTIPTMPGKQKRIGMANDRYC
jgi:hypothetical protein